MRSTVYRNNHSKSQLKRHLLTALSTVILLTAVMSACSFPWQKPRLVLAPEVVAELPLTGNLSTQEPAQVVSPDGKYIIAEERDSQVVRMVAVPLGSGEKVVFSSVDAWWASEHYVWHYPIGWVSSDQCVYLTLGEGQGEGKDRRGVRIMTGNIKTRKVEESAFIHLSSGEFRSATVIQDKAKALIHVSGALWEYDTAKKSLRQVKDNLPTYDGLFYLAMSPTGEYALYRLAGENGGLYILETATGTERPLLTDGDTMSFLPSWSPDGNWISAYTVPKRPNAEDLQPWEQYDYFEGEDAPLSISPSITVIDPRGNQKRSITVDGKFLSRMAWGSDSRTLAFLAGTEDTDRGDSSYIYEPVSYDSAMMVDISGNEPPYLVADLESMPGFKGAHVSGFCAAVKPAAKGLYFVASRDGEFEFWYGVKDKSPVKVSDGYWSAPMNPPAYEDYTLGLVNSDGESTLWLLGSLSQSKMGEFGSAGSWVDVAGYSEDLVIVRNDQYQSNACLLTVYRMFNEAERMR